MKLLVFVVDKVELLPTVLQKLEYQGLRGATILKSKGMAMTLSRSFGGSLLGSLYAMMDPDREENRTVFMVLKDKDVYKVLKIIESVIGDFNNPNNGIFFTVPVDFVKGILLDDGEN